MGDDAELLLEMHRALLAELGARTIYRRAAALVRDEELRNLLAGFADDERKQIDELRTTMTALGGKPIRRSLRRTLLAEALAWTIPFAGPRFALRICFDAEQKRARWYAHFHEYLAARGERRFDAALQRMFALKQLHTHTLQA